MKTSQEQQGYKNESRCYTCEFVDETDEHCKLGGFDVHYCATCDYHTTETK